MKNITTYVSPQRAIEKLKFARSLAETVYVGAATGYGKTELIRQYLQNRNYVYVSCEEEWTPQSVREEIRKTRRRSSAANMTVVVDDLQQLQDDDRRDFLLELSAEKGIWLVMLGRSPLPEWLSALLLSRELTCIEERELALNARGVIRLFQGEMDGRAPDPEEAARIAEYFQGDALGVYYLISQMREEKYAPEEPVRMSAQLQEQCGQLFRDYMNTSVIPGWDPDVVKFCMQISVVDEFDVELAEYITGDARVTELMARFEQFSSGLESAADGIYRFRNPMLLALAERRDRVYDAQKVRQFYYNAGLYYEAHGRILDAVRMYEKCGSDRIQNLLVLNSRRNPANGYYYELREYYLALPEEVVRENVYLMSGMSMLCSLLLEPDRSDYWYRELHRYWEGARGGEKKEAQLQLIYLEIALPQREIANLVDIFRRIPSLVFSGGYQLPEFSVTSNLPSMMDGGKDFSEWSRHDRALASSIGQIVTRALGRYGRGLVPLALAESQFEKGGDFMEILNWISRGQMQTQNGGKIEMEFVAAGLLARVDCASGRCDEAAAQLRTFREKVVDEGAEKLLGNIDALLCKLALYTGDLQTVETWMQTAPDERRDFFVMERLRYLTKVRCYIVLGQDLRAISLTQKLLTYARRYQRTIVTIETELLMALLLYRGGNEQWAEHLREGVKLAGSYEFVETISREGAAILPLLQELLRRPDQGGLQGEVPEEWLSRVVQATERMARRYPAYLQDTRTRTSDFSRKAIDVLTLQAKGYTVAQISGALGMKPETVRYHIKQNYRKLQVSSKSEAVLAARDLGLL